MPKKIPKSKMIRIALIVSWAINMARTPNATTNEETTIVVKGTVSPSNNQFDP